jgi:hypothetical protein
LRTTMNLGLDPAVLVGHAAAEASIGNDLDEDSLNRERFAGSQLSLDRVVAEAIGVIDAIIADRQPANVRYGSDFHH